MHYATSQHSPPITPLSMSCSPVSMHRLLIHWVSPVAAVVLWLPVVWRVTVVAVAVGYVAAWAVATAGQK